MTSAQGAKQSAGSSSDVGGDLRAFRWTDIPAAVRIEVEAFPYDPWSVETFWSELAQVPSGALYLAAVTEGRIDGYAGMTFVDADAHLQTLAVIPSLRGRGIGRHLLTALLAEATGRGMRRCLLEVKPDNDSAIALYQRTGFTELGTRPGYFPGGEPALVLELPLGERV